MTEPTIKVKRLAYVRVSAPDTAKAEPFLNEFGLQVAARADGAVYFRGTDPEPPCYVLTQGEGAVNAIAFEAESAEDLERIAQIDGASAVEALDEPAGGQVVRLTDPQGMCVEIVQGRSALDPLAPAPSHPFNMNGHKPREGALPAVRKGPSHVKHLPLRTFRRNLIRRYYRTVHPLHLLQL